MYQLLRTYLIGEDRKYELYGDIDSKDKVTRVLEYSYRSLNPDEKTAHWVCMGPVDISEFKDRSMHPELYGRNIKQNDISSIREFCIQISKS